MIIKNIESKIRLVTIAIISILVMSITICLAVIFFAYKQVALARQVVYVLESGIPKAAMQTDMHLNRPIEYHGHVEMFHQLFFTLTPDEKHIQQQMSKAFYLIDESGGREYNNLREKGFFNSILSSSAVSTLQTDSIIIDAKRSHFTYYGKAKIARKTSILTRSLITEGYLTDIPRSENNPFGALINTWKTIENKNLKNDQRNSY